MNSVRYKMTICLFKLHSSGRLWCKVIKHTINSGNFVCDTICDMNHQFMWNLSNSCGHNVCWAYCTNNTAPFKSTFVRAFLITIKVYHYANKKRTRHLKQIWWCKFPLYRLIPFIFSSYDLMAVSLLNDSCGFHIHARHMYVLPRGCARDENTSHPDYTQVFHW